MICQLALGQLHRYWLPKLFLCSQVILDVSCTSNCFGLSHTVYLVKVSDSLCGLISVEDRHIEVHEDKTVDMLTLVVRIRYEGEGFFIIVSPVHHVIKQIETGLPN